ncbi:unnamed protein product [Trichogramma brassicae]|uniref:Integrase catalytic domain-containing protein n=1 Tax=Trichogramma brassicae TaxID=86971 RepID=A0A6H5IJF1_9HYME|nr:unnamed protein product [Trichogramma brassicae]
MSCERLFPKVRTRKKAIQSDHGSQFTSKPWTFSINRENIKIIFSSIRHPQSNLVERYNKEIGRFLRTLAGNDHPSWANWCQAIAEIMNTTVNKTTGFCPLELQTGQKPERFWTKYVPTEPETKTYEQVCEEARANIQKKGQARAEKWNNEHKTTSLDIGNLVLVKALRVPSGPAQRVAKLLSLYEGPYEIDHKRAEATGDQEKTPSVGSTATTLVLHGERHDTVSERSGSLVQASTGRKRKARDDVGQDPVRRETHELICQWVEDVNRAAKFRRCSDSRKPLAARENTHPMVCAVRPRCVQNPSSPTPSIVPVRPPSTIDLVSLEDDDEPIIVCEVFHARRPTTPRHIRPASVIIIEPAASPPGSSVTSPSLSLESRPPSPLRFSPTPSPSYSPISSASENYSSDENGSASRVRHSPRPVPSVQSASESHSWSGSDDTPQVVNPAWVPNEPVSDDEEIDHEVALIWGQRAFQAAADEGYFSARSINERFYYIPSTTLSSNNLYFRKEPGGLCKVTTLLFLKTSADKAVNTQTRVSHKRLSAHRTGRRESPPDLAPHLFLHDRMLGPQKKEIERGFSPRFFAAYPKFARMRCRRCIERRSSGWRGQSPTGIKGACFAE